MERGDAGQVLVNIARQPDDLLVIGTGRRNPVGRALHRSVGRYCLAHAKCPVIAVPPSALMDEVRRGLLPGRCAAGTRSCRTSMSLSCPTSNASITHRKRARGAAAAAPRALA